MNNVITLVAKIDHTDLTFMSITFCQIRGYTSHLLVDLQEQGIEQPASPTKTK